MASLYVLGPSRGTTRWSNGDFLFAGQMTKLFDDRRRTFPGQSHGYSWVRNKKWEHISRAE